MSHPELPIHLLSINMPGYEDSIPAMGEDAALPILQDDTEADVWTSWEAEWRDVVVLDADNVETGRLNLTTHTLASEVHRETLKTMLIDAASD